MIQSGNNRGSIESVHKSLVAQSAGLIVREAPEVAVLRCTRLEMLGQCPVRVLVSKVDRIGRDAVDNLCRVVSAFDVRSHGSSYLPLGLIPMTCTETNDLAYRFLHLSNVCVKTLHLRSVVAMLYTNLLGFYTTETFGQYLETGAV